MDVHDPKGRQKTLYKKVCVDFFAPNKVRPLLT